MPTRHPIKRVLDRLQEKRENHSIRHSPTGHDFAFSDRISFLNPACWDEIASQTGGFFLQRRILEVLERNSPENISPRYAVVYSGMVPVAVLAAQLVTVGKQEIGGTRDSARASRPILKRLLAPAARPLADRLKERILVGGNLFSWGFHGIAFGGQADPSQSWHGIAEALYRIRRAERLSGQTDLAMVKDISSGQLGIEELRRFGYRPLETEPNMVLPIHPGWRSYEDYLGALDAKYRRNAKDQVKKLAAAGCVIERIDDLSPHSERLHQLYLSVQSNAAVRLVTLPQGYLPALSRAAGPDFRCTIIRKDSQILGFVSSIRDGETAIGYYIGFDREAAASGIPLYLRLLHTTIGDAIDWGCTRLSLGRTALEPKAAMGAQPEVMTVWLRHRVPVMNWMVRGMISVVTHDEAPERNPFKKGPVEADAG